MDRTVPRAPFFEILTEMQAILGKDNPKIMSQVGMRLGRKWGKSIHDEVTSIEDLFERAADYLQNEMKFAEKVEVEHTDKNTHTIKFGSVTNPDECQCILCCGNIVKEKGGVPACPMSQFVIGALREVKDKLPTKMLQLKGIEKPGPVGVCNQHIYIEPRPVVYSPEEFATKIKNKTVKLADLGPYMNIVTKIANKNELVQSKTKNWVHSIELRVDDGPIAWFKADKGKFTAGTSQYEGMPDLTIEISKENAVDILLMESTPEEFMESGDLRINGTIRDAVKFRRILETVRSVLSSM
ncbi:MAG: SCP2 sterol-binding domain-containing protein [Candidatus Hodarchaeales archaeon]